MLVDDIPKELTIVKLIKSNDIKALSKYPPNAYLFASPRFMLLIEDSGKIRSFDLNSHNITTLHVAAYYNCLETYLYLERNFFSSIPFNEILDLENNTPLHFALFNNSLNVACYILSKYPEEASHHDFIKLEYLYMALMNDSSQLVEILIKNGAKVPTKNNEFWNLVYSKKNQKIIEIIMNSINICPQYSDSTILMKALLNEYLEIVPILINNDQHPKYINENGISPLIICIDFLKNLEITKMILDAIYGDIDVPKGSNYTPLVHYLCKCDNIDIIKAVLSRGIDVNRFDKHYKVGPAYIKNLRPDI